MRVRQATREEDFAGADCFLNDLGVGHRKRGISIHLYGQISIRKIPHRTSEYDKILQGISRADLQIHEFTDAYIICTTSDIRAALESPGKAHHVDNGDGTGAYYIHINHIPHVVIPKIQEPPNPAETEAK